MAAGEAPSQLVLLTGVGPRLTRWKLQLREGGLSELGTVVLPANIQYAWPHPSGKCLYVASSDGGGRNGPPGECHHITAVSTRSAPILRASIALPSRPIHVTVDPQGRHVLAAFNQPAAIRAFRIGADGNPGAEVAPVEPFDPGHYPHQVRVAPDGETAISTALGQNAGPGRPEDPGALHVFRYEDGRLRHTDTVAPWGGYGFGPRHLDFHPGGRWVYVSLERQNRLAMFKLQAGRLSPVPLFSVPVLSGGQQRGVKQIAGAVHMHPSGRFVYVVNRASDTRRHGEKDVFAGGENTLAVFRIHPDTGEPVAIQHVDTGGIHCRTFGIDRTGNFLVAAHIMGLDVLEGDRIRSVPPCLSVFRIGADGCLSPEYTLPMQTSGDALFWMGIDDRADGAPTPLNKE